MKFSTYYDKVRACWLGKNIGGTLGMPREGHRGVFDLSYYTHDLSGGSFPNDDLDLQLVALIAAERHGLSLSAEILGEYWLTYVPCDWSEYGAGKSNLRRGFLPPVSGAFYNGYARSNGAFIRSELWACLCPGDPAQAVKYAFADASVDHSGEGVYGELFCAAVQSAAFALSDIPALVEIGLSFLPDDCLLRRCIELVKACYREGKDWRVARKELLQFAPSPFGLRYVYDNDLPDKNPEPDIPMGEVGNDAATTVAIAVIGLLWGEGDFDKSLTIAASCGEDTDCTAGFIGAMMGILRGTAAIDKKWTEPIGIDIKTISVDPSKGGVCRTVVELSDRVSRLMPTFCRERIRYGEGCEPEVTMPARDALDRPIKLGLFEYADKRTFLSTTPLFVEKSCAVFDARLSFASVELPEDGVCRLTLTAYNHHDRPEWLRLKWHLPSGVSVSGGSESSFYMDQFTGITKLSSKSYTLCTEGFESGELSLLLEISIPGRPTRLFLPVTFFKG